MYLDFSEDCQGLLIVPPKLHLSGKCVTGVDRSSDSGDQNGYWSWWVRCRVSNRVPSRRRYKTPAPGRHRGPGAGMFFLTWLRTYIGAANLRVGR